MKLSLAKYRLQIIGVLAGACAGYLYYYFVGCASGTCLITSKPVNSTLYGALMGWLLFSSFKNEKANSEQHKIDNHEQQ